MWGLVIKNAPAYLWWKDFRRDMLPLTVRVGNRFSMEEGWSFLVDGEKRFYREGGRTQDVLHLGAETRVFEALTLRGGVFSDDIEKPAQRHWTGGATVTSGGGASITVGWERFTAIERVQRFFLSISAPFFAP